MGEVIGHSLHGSRWGMGSGMGAIGGWPRWGKDEVMEASGWRWKSKVELYMGCGIGTWVVGWGHGLWEGGGMGCGIGSWE